MSADRWRAALDFQPEEPDALTARELCDLFRVSEPTISRRLRALIAAGRVRVATRRVALADGRVRRIPAYVLLDVPKGKRAA